MFEFLDKISNQYLIKLGITVVLILFFNIFVRLILKWSHSAIKDITKYHRFKKFIYYFFYGLLVLTILFLWFENLGSFGTFLGLFTAGVAIALKDVFANIAGWFIITLRKPFDVGDRIELGANSGDVIDIRLFQFTLMETGKWINADQSTGRITHIPNSVIFTEALSNSTKGFMFIWNEVTVVLTFESDWQLAKTLFLEIIEEVSKEFEDKAQKELKKATKKYLIMYNYLSPKVYTRIVGSGVELSLRYLCDPRQKRSTQEEISEHILQIVQSHENITLAYDTFRVTQH